MGFSSHRPFVLWETVQPQASGSHGLAGVVLASEHDAALHAFRRPPFLVGASAPDILRLWLAPVRGLPEPRVTCYSVPLHHKGVLPVPTRHFIRNAHTLGAAVHVWTVDNTRTARHLLERGTNGIITNDPGRMLAAGWPC